MHVVIRLPNWLGDAVLARPLVHRLRSRFPDASLTVVGPTPALAAMAGIAVVREPWPKVAAERRGLTQRIRAEKADVALVLPPSFSSAWWAWRTGAHHRLGYAGDGRSVLLTSAMRRPPRGDLHLSQEYLALAEPLGNPAGTPDSRPPRLPSDDAGEAAAAALLARHGLAGEGHVVLAPGAIYGTAKRWPADRFVALGRRLLASGLTPLLCGTAAEREPCAGVAGAIGAGAVSVAGDTDLPCLIALCASARLVVCNDSGMAHVAAATGSATVVVFGSTSSAWTAPLGPSVQVVQDAPVCSPCFQRTCTIGVACLEAVTVAAVTAAARRLGVRCA